MSSTSGRVSVCDLCAVASLRANESGASYECACGETYEPRASRVVAAPAAPAATSDDTGAHRIRRAPPARSWSADDAPAVAGLAPLARAAADARRRAPSDPELVRVRVLLATLRPDCPDPLVPPAKVDVETSAAPMPRDPTASHGGVPRGVEFGGGRGDYDPATMQALVDVLDEIDALPAPAPEVLRWMREHATLREGLRGLYADAGEWAAVEGMAPPGTLAIWQVDFSARRDGAPALGRRLVLAAAGAWGK